MDKLIPILIYVGIIIIGFISKLIEKISILNRIEFTIVHYHYTKHICFCQVVFRKIFNFFVLFSLDNPKHICYTRCKYIGEEKTLWRLVKEYIFSAICGA